MYAKLAFAGAVAFVAACLAWFFGIRITFICLGLLTLPMVSGSLPFATMCTVVGIGVAFALFRILLFFIGWRRLLQYFGYFVVFACILIVGGIAKTRHFQISHKQQYDDFLAIHTPNGIQEGLYVPIGGIEQWVQIRGEDRSNPILLFIHGGPGGSTLPLSSVWRKWERYFTVVQWDERGTGRTFRNTGSAILPTMTVDRMASDGIEVAEFLKSHLHQEKIILVGHSWGSFLAVHMVRMKPELFAAYVGTGQIIGAPTWKKKLANGNGVPNGEDISAINFPVPPYAMPDFTIMDCYYWLRGMRVSRALLGGPGGPMAGVDLRSLGLDFTVPIFFFEGTRDFNTPIQPAAQYLAAITAPHKEFVPFEGADHFLPMERPDEFLGQLLLRVRPWTVSRPKG